MKKLVAGILALAVAAVASAQPTPAGGAAPATQAEVDAGVIANKYVSPLTLKNAGTAGDVTGPASSTDNALALFDSTTGKLLKNSVTIANPTTGAISGFTTGTGLTFHGGGTITGASNALSLGATSLTLTSPLNAVNVASGITPAVELEVDSTSTSSPRGIMSAQFNTGTDGARFHMRKARGTRASPTVVVTGDNLGRLVASGYDGASYLEMGSIIFGTTGTIGTNRIPTTIVFQTATDAAPSVLTTALTLDASQQATFASQVTSTAGGYTASAGGAFLWAGRASIQSPANGQANMTVTNQGTGVGLDFGTDSTFKIRNRAQNADGALTAGAATFSKVLATTPSALTYASPTSVDVTLSNVYTVTTVNATGSVTFNATAGGTAGAHYTFIITNDATSAKTITFGTNFSSMGTLTPAGASKVVTIEFISNGTTLYELCRSVIP